MKLALIPVPPFGRRIKLVSDADFASLVAATDFTSSDGTLTYTAITSKKYNAYFVDVPVATIAPKLSPPPPPPSTRAAKPSVTEGGAK